MPTFFSPSECLLHNSVTTLIGLRLAFSGNVYGITSKASAYPLIQYDSIPVNVFAYSASQSDISISGAPPPEIITLPKHTCTLYIITYCANRFFTKHLITHSAS